MQIIWIGNLELFTLMNNKTNHMTITKDMEPQKIIRLMNESQSNVFTDIVNTLISKDDVYTTAATVKAQNTAIEIMFITNQF